MNFEMSSTPFGSLQNEASPPSSLGPSAARPERNLWQAIKHGARGKCPNCGKGKLFYRYLKVNDRCASCGEELFHHRADDAPPYVTILVVGHIVGAGILTVDAAAPDLPLVYHMVTWPLLTIVLSLVLLPIFKGGLIGLQWALRMHGFETAGVTPQSASAPQSSSAE